ncbi:hypothetical protein [Cryobacterium sp. CG_9.6]|uniref:hypothetical protein n=1 Tax=Cryobacterium sp. CG_9.6 TaxID=2760710 RepID=UPI002475444A|nr:hypothetical protein [Cryobacterium sp. CG_9.6]MDH6238312.1 tetratricopeptide (TPR) repeat protein [Cryobacterium sp. CG_9.6]
MNSVSVNDSSITVSEELVAACRLLAAEDPARESDLALALTRLSNRQSTALNSRKALLAAQEAVHIYQRLADADPDGDVEPLARALNILALRLVEVGRRDKALFVSERAVSMERMRPAGPAEGTPIPGVGSERVGSERVGSERADSERAGSERAASDLADSLDTLALCLRETGREQQSRASAREATEIREGLREHRRREHRTDTV